MAVTDIPSQTKTRWTAAKYFLWSRPDDGNLYEVLNGELIMAAAPILRHQEVSGNIFELLKSFVRSKKLGKVYLTPVDVVLGDEVVEPDIVFVSTDRKEIMSKERIVGAPDLVVEVLSLSTSARDLRYKWDLYARSRGCAERSNCFAAPECRRQGRAGRHPLATSGWPRDVHSKQPRRSRRAIRRRVRTPDSTAEAG